MYYSNIAFILEQLIVPWRSSEFNAINVIINL